VGARAAAAAAVRAWRRGRGGPPPLCEADPVAEVGVFVERGTLVPLPASPWYGAPENGTAASPCSAAAPWPALVVQASSVTLLGGDAPIRGAVVDVGGLPFLASVGNFSASNAALRFELLLSLVANASVAIENSDVDHFAGAAAVAAAAAAAPCAGGEYAGMFAARGGSRSPGVSFDGSRLRVPVLHAHGEEALQLGATVVARSLPWRANCSAPAGEWGGASLRGGCGALAWPAARCCRRATTSASCSPRTPPPRRAARCRCCRARWCTWA
jgi:hypothetical protein